MENQSTSTWRSDAALLALALMWGTSHVITKEILASHSPSFYTSTRFGIASICFGLMFAGRLRRSSREEIRQGIVLGLCSFAGIGFYVVGMVFTQASKAGFITGLYLVFTPLIGFVLFKLSPTRRQLIGLAVAICGFILLSFPRSGESINWGDVLVLLAAAAWATHIAATSAFARRSDVRTLAAVQVFTVAALAIVTHLVLRSCGLEKSPNTLDWHFAVRIGYMAMMVTFVAALVQTWAQGRVSPSHAVIFYALEPATAAVYAYLRFGEKLSPMRGLGAVLIVIGVIVSRLSKKKVLSPEKEEVLSPES